MDLHQVHLQATKSPPSSWCISKFFNMENIFSNSFMTSDKFYPNTFVYVQIIFSSALLIAKMLYKMLTFNKFIMASNCDVAYVQSKNKRTRVLMNGSNEVSCNNGGLHLRCVQKCQLLMTVNWYNNSVIYNLTVKSRETSYYYNFLYCLDRAQSQ